VAAENDDPTMPFRASSEAEADQNENTPYTGLTLEDEESQLTPPKSGVRKADAEPAKVTHATPPHVEAQKPPVEAQNQADGGSSEEAGHVSIPQTDEPEHAPTAQNDPPGHVSMPSTEEPVGPTLPQPEPKAAEPAPAPVHHPQTSAEKRRLIAERAGLRGFKGFCPVVLRDQRNLADANPGYCSVYHGQRYCFSSSAAQACFDAAPHKYAPVAAGMDVVVKANTDQTVEGSLDFALWYKDRLYLFCSPESLQAFSGNPTAYAAAAKRMQ
jgi:YHS domain-containing protein